MSNSDDVPHPIGCLALLIVIGLMTWFVIDTTKNVAYYFANLDQRIERIEKHLQIPKE